RASGGDPLSPPLFGWQTAMQWHLLPALLFAGLLWLDWRWHFRVARIGAVLLAIGVLFFVQPNLTAARRRAWGLPPEERVVQVRDERVSDYMSGVLTMEQVIAESAAFMRPARLIALSALILLALMPATRSNRRASGTARKLLSAGEANATVELVDAADGERR
ncbi:MAG TPA: hypothetical protein VHG28_22015, partial [Longimicrobiaceae bacterium]|nr:hypothetical protein [Longimicrobiaceae bacterium]